MSCHSIVQPSLSTSVVEPTASNTLENIQHPYKYMRENRCENCFVCENVASLCVGKVCMHRHDAAIRSCQ